MISTIKLLRPLSQLFRITRVKCAPTKQIRIIKGRNASIVCWKNELERDHKTAGFYADSQNSLKFTEGDQFFVSSANSTPYANWIYSKRKINGLPQWSLCQKTKRRKILSPRCSVSRWRPQKVDKRMVLEYTHGLFIT